MSMLRGLKVSSLACKCAFYRPEHKGNPWNSILRLLKGRNVEMRYTNR